MRLLPISAFEEVFSPLKGKKIGFVQGHGNVGDMLIEKATFQLFRAYGIQWRSLVPEENDLDGVEEIVYGGGGNMGGLYPRCQAIRQWCLSTNLPITVLPQSFYSREDWGYERVFVRDRDSLTLTADATLAPDLALGMKYRTTISPRYKQGVFLRRDSESKLPKWHYKYIFRRDPVRICKTPEQYLHLAALYQHILTDRLHFAIAGLICGRRVTLLPNSYHKNESMYRTWLKGLGCEFLPRLP